MLRPRDRPTDTRLDRSMVIDGRANVAIKQLAGDRAPAPDHGPPSGRLYQSGRWSVFEMGGEMDLQIVPVLRGLQAGDASHLVFDLRRVTFMDCGGLGALVASSRTALRFHGRVRVVGGSPQVRRLLTLTHVERAVSLFDSLEEALTEPDGNRGR